MFALLPLLLALEVAPQKTVIRYVRPAGEKFVLESEVTITREKDRARYVSRTVRGDESMTLSVERSLDGKLIKAEIVHVIGKVKKTARVDPGEDKLLLTREGVREYIDAKNPVLFTTAPDWSDILEMGARFDDKKEGKQEFVGVWFHPSQPAQLPKFSIERLGADKIEQGGKEHALSRCRVRIRGGSAYLVWVTGEGRVVKLVPEGGKGAPVILEGFEEATKELR